MDRRALPILVAVIAFAGIVGCAPQPENLGPRFGTSPAVPRVAVYHLAVYPLHNPAKLMRAYQPLVDHLNGRLQGASLALEASRDYATFEKKFRARKLEFLLPNPWQTLQAMQVGYRVIAIAGEPHDFRGLFVVRKNSGLTCPADLKGKAVSYPSPTAMAACIMPQYFLQSHGIQVTSDIENRYVGSQESAIMNAYLGLTAAGATWPTPWRAFQREHPQEAAQLKVIWETKPLVNNSVMARGDVPSRVVEQVHEILLGLDATPEGKAILAGMETRRFLPASNEDYEAVRQYVSRFEREARRVEER